MIIAKPALLAALSTALLLAGCAVSPEAESRRQATEAEIAAILSQPLDPAEYGEARRCISESELRNFEALDDRRIVFEGRQGRLWINTLRTTCPDLQYAQVLRVKSISFSRICDMDRFLPSDWFYWPWYRRWPWAYDRDWGMAMSCTLGDFQPVTEEQVAEIKAVLRANH
jgi:hypothetical protein